MTKIVSIEQMRAVEAAADKAGVTYARMMEAAGQAVAHAILVRLDQPSRHKAVILCGHGNNGGDGLVAAYHLAEAGVTVAVYFPAPPDENNPNLQRVRAKGLTIAIGENDTDGQILKKLLSDVTVLVDAVFGTGARLPLAGKPAELLQRTAQYLAAHPAPRPLRVAVDCPSGLNCNTGVLDAAALPADLTVTFAAAKRGQFGFPASNALGELMIADIGVPDNLPELAAVKLALGTRALTHALLPPRPRHAHKGTFGRAIIAAGSVNYTGAAYLAGAAAYRIGAGLVTLAVPAPLHPILASQLLEATWIILPAEMGVIAGGAADVLFKALGGAQALLIGPGLGNEKETLDFLRRLLQAEAGPHKSHMGFAHDDETGPSPKPSALPPLVIDADGLRLLAQIENWPKHLPRETVLTPHPGEMAALTGWSKDKIQADRIGTALKFAAEWGHVVMLKGAFSVVAAPDGRATVQPFATAALARAGTGDVLAGAITGLLAQGVQPYEAAVAASYLHGRAGELAAETQGNTASVLAGDVLTALPQALTETGSQ